MSDDLADNLENGVRFLHTMSMQTKLDLADTSSRIHGLIEELVAQGVVSLRRLEERTERARKEEGERAKNQLVVHVGSAVDKYGITSTPQIDCASLIELCKGRCCKLSFPLSFQDLDERVVQWDYGHPYVIRQGEDGYCVHSGETRGCTVYAQRPSVCRTYDCRKDSRVWVDFDKRIPAPDDAIPLVRIRKRSTSQGSGDPTPDPTPAS